MADENIIQAQEQTEAAKAVSEGGLDDQTIINSANSKPETQLKITTSKLSPGDLLDERFEIVSMVGKGGMCVVYKAINLRLSQVCAVKMLHAHLNLDDEAQQRFQREAIAASSLQHQNIIGLIAYGFRELQPYMVMEFLEGESLADVLKTRGRIPADEALPWFYSICDALEHAHQNGVIHRDLKPSNVMLPVGEQELKLVDFGIAKVLPSSGKDLQKLTKTGDVLGTVIYMSPEQCQGILPDPRSDIYSMGCLMYEVLTGKPPLAGRTTIETMAKHLNEEPQPSEILSDELNAVILRALYKDPSKRQQSAGELKSELLKASNLKVQLKKRKKAKKVVLWWISACALMLLAVGAIWNQQIQSKKDAFSTILDPHRKEQNQIDHLLAGPDTLQLADQLEGLAVRYQEKGNWAQAEAFLKRSLAIKDKLLGPYDLSVADTLVALNVCYYHQEKYADSEPLMERILAIREKVLGPNDPLVDYSREGLSDCYIKLSKFAKAEPLLKRFLASQEKVLNSTDRATFLLKLAHCYNALKQYVKAEQLFRRTLAVQEKALEPHDHEIGVTLEWLSHACSKQGKYAEEELLLRRSLAIEERRLEQNKIRPGKDVLEIQGYLAECLIKQGKLAEAKRLLQRAKNIESKKKAAYEQP